MTNPTNLSSGHGGETRFKEALKLNAPLAAAYYMKEDLRQFWEQSGRESAQKSN
ncbi:MAG: transposase [Desulfovibrio sp.]|nr:transposase [Desulfovibrio sp.]